MKKLKFITLLLLSVLALFSSFNLAQSNRRDARVQPEKVMDVIGVKPGMVIGEAGAGRGYLTFKLSRRVGETGMIYAIYHPWYSLFSGKTFLHSLHIVHLSHSIWHKIGTNRNLILTWKWS